MTQRKCTKTQTPEEPSSNGILRSEWIYILPGESRENNDCSKAQTSFDGVASDKRPTQEINDFDDDLGDALSETSDPVFQWLEGAV
ncbi:hypothetical protein DD238_002826 [Peronospora effusa]|uniref:Uncharacterized protein n=1 Tax=Peronospora effusa TaxID=542832 RepID=A0A3M6VG78_9STRA|nr:hypothetical protein DD238_002826 [Peronospora effusa]RQM10091.1 hypothetical protein DD237_005041 [Peronospora effusa]